VLIRVLAAFPLPVPIPATDAQELVFKIGLYVALLISLSFHEYGHAWSAKKLGDDTADHLGRLTLNPLAHIDLMFTVVLPLIFLFGPGAGSGFFFGAAKPNPVNLRKPTRDMMLTSAAGPAMNVVLALFFTAAYWFHTEVRDVPWSNLSSLMIKNAIELNLVLAVFNMLPIPPLDGHRVLGYFLPANLRENFYRLGTGLGFAILIVLLFTGVLGRIMSPILFRIQEWWGVLMPGGIPLWYDGR
jgi:Zn-dependent protease